MPGKALTVALREINAPRPYPIDEATLVLCLTARLHDRRWAPHVHAFLEELPVEIIHDAVIEGAATFAELARAVENWGCLDGNSVDWIKEMAALSLEVAA